MRLCIVLTLVMCGTANAEPVSFRNDVMAVLSRAGCNQGTCHGNQHGKGGFKLSLRGQSPAADYRELTRSLEGRRVDLVNPDQSLLLLKPVMQVPHEGGRRLMADSPEYQILRDWISAGLPNDVTTAPRIQELQVIPVFANVPANGAPVEINANAQLSDGTQRDVASLCVYDSSA
ncbi:MAG: cell surface protein, partial [Planctomycetaceae bacterium]|nr:cell surface protein [Planctomycetaceae bacterium]